MVKTPFAFLKSALAAIILFSAFQATAQLNHTEMGTEKIGKSLNFNPGTGMCNKQSMAADGIVRLSKIEVYPQFIEEYLEYAREVGEISLRTEPGVLTMFAIQEKESPCTITILEIYASKEAYSHHISSPHFQKYKQGTLHMVRNLVLSDQNVINPANILYNYIK